MSEVGPETERLTARWADAQNVPPLAAVLKSVAASVAAALEHGYGSDVVERALKLMLSSRQIPSPHSVVWAERLVTAEVQINEWGGREREPLQEAFSCLIDGYGWPTGSRFYATLQSGSYRQCTLGYERPDYSPPWSSPDKEEIMRELEADPELVDQLLATEPDDHWIREHLRHPDTGKAQNLGSGSAGLGEPDAEGIARIKQLSEGLFDDVQGA